MKIIINNNDQNGVDVDFHTCRIVNRACQATGQIVWEELDVWAYGRPRNGSRGQDNGVHPGGIKRFFFWKERKIDLFA